MVVIIVHFWMLTTITRRIRGEGRRLQDPEYRMYVRLVLVCSGYIGLRTLTYTNAFLMLQETQSPKVGLTRKSAQQHKSTAQNSTKSAQNSTKQHKQHKVSTKSAQLARSSTINKCSII